MKKIVWCLLFLLSTRASAQISVLGYGDTIAQLQSKGNKTVYHILGDLAGGECYSFRDDYLSVTTTGKIMKPEDQQRFADYHWYSNVSLFYNFPFYYPYVDTSFFYDSSIFHVACDTFGYCESPSSSNLISSTMDADHNYHMLIIFGVPVPLDASAHVPIKMVYFKASHIDTTINGFYQPFNIPLRATQPFRIISYKLMDTIHALSNNFTDHPFYEHSITANIFTDKFRQPYFIYHSEVSNEQNKQLYFCRLDTFNNIIQTDSLNSAVGNYCTSVHAVNNITVRDTLYILTKADYDFNCNRVPDSVVYKMYAVDSFANFSPGINMTPAQFDRYILHVKNDPVNTIYRNLPHDSSVVKYFNQNGDTLKTVFFPKQFAHPVIETKTGKYVHIYLTETGGVHTIVSLFDSTGKFIKSTYRISEGAYYDSILFPRTFASIDTFDNVFFGYNDHYDNIGSSHCNGSSSHRDIFNAESLNQIFGTVLKDKNKNCIADAGEPWVEGILVELQLNGKSYFTQSNSGRNFWFDYLEEGNGRVILHTKNQTYFTSVCGDTFNIVIRDTLSNPKINFLVQTESCPFAAPKMNVNISAPVLRRCFDNLYTLSVYNASEDTAHHVYSDVQLDRYLIATDTQFTSAQYLGNNTYRFQFGDVLPLETQRKHLTVKVECDSTVPGQTHCVTATVSPYVWCSVPQQPHLTAFANCENDSVIFYIQNDGYPASWQKNYTITVNDTVKYAGYILFDASHTFMRLAFANSSGATLRLETVQNSIYPNEDTILSAAFEGCGNAIFSTGYLPLFPTDNGIPTVYTDCQINRSSFDPNEKTAQPAGFGDSAYILPNTPIEYTIHFQNTGTYYASSVIITDTISTLLNPATFEWLSSSDPFYYSFIDS
ncbi:MAG: hypothetical protein JWN78_2049, partial [Bacteroidota bacterium]|nr:hypothetical protein [Bacteroidota bacterium]